LKKLRASLLIDSLGGSFCAIGPLGKLKEQYMRNLFLGTILIALVLTASASGVENKQLLAKKLGADATAGWVKHPTPVLSGDDGTVNDPFVLLEDGTFRMWHT
jgi:hypothetical protein